jgi:hypothetical protein
MGDVVAAVDHYTDIPEPTRQALKEKMRLRKYDEIVLIKRDSIEGKSVYSSQIYDMHFGNGKMCQTVTRNKWSHTHQERGLVYCANNECIIVPTVCRNVSRIRKPAATSGKSDGPLLFDAPGTGMSTVEPAEPAPSPELVFDPPVAGPTPTSTPQTFSQSVAPQDRPFQSASFPNVPVFTSAPPVLPPGTVPAIPEPATYLLFGAGISVIYIRKKYVGKNSVV